MASLSQKTIFITGATRGIGRAIALRAAKDGANVAIAAKTAAPHPKLPGTLGSVAEEIKAAGGNPLPLQVDVRFEEQIQQAVETTAATFGGIDVCVNNASAISLTGTLDTPLKKFDLMLGVNARATFATSRACLPFLLKAKNPHLLNLSPPLNLNPKWFQNHVAYTLSKYGMSFCVLGMAEEFRSQGVAVNALWPKTAIATAAIEMLMGPEATAHCRTADIVADAAHWILTQPSRNCTANFFIDEAVLRNAGVSDFSHYEIRKDGPLVPDFFLD